MALFSADVVARGGQGVSRSMGASRPSALSSAARTSSHRDAGKLQIHGPRSGIATERIYSGLSVEATPSPSLGFSTTSHGSPRIWVENGITGRSLTERSSESRRRTSTGRRLSGDERRYQRTSPRLSSLRAMRRRHPTGPAVRVPPTPGACGAALRQRAPTPQGGAARSSRARAGPPTGAQPRRGQWCCHERPR